MQSKARVRYSQSRECSTIERHAREGNSRAGTTSALSHAARVHSAQPNPTGKGTSQQRSSLQHSTPRTTWALRHKAQPSNEGPAHLPQRLLAEHRQLEARVRPRQPLRHMPHHLPPGGAHEGRGRIVCHHRHQRNGGFRLGVCVRPNRAPAATPAPRSCCRAAFAIARGGSARGHACCLPRALRHPSRPTPAPRAHPCAARSCCSERSQCCCAHAAAR